ncbi:MAG: DUF3598 domain-containing protein [Pseudomonadota bacterium]
MTSSAELQRLMPELCRHEGVWEGTYRYLLPDLSVADSHGSRLICRTRDLEGRFPYDQTNISLWEDGRELVMDFPATYADGGIMFDDAVIKGRFSEVEGDPSRLTIFGTWVWTDASMVPFPTTDLIMYEMIQSSACGQHRARTWHWVDSGKIVLRTLIEEHKVTADWKAWEAENAQTAPVS